MDGELKENSDLLRKRSKPSTNGNLSHDGLSGPPDGGFRAFTVVLGSFLTNGLIFGVINSCSVIYSVHELHFDKDVNAKGRAALVGSLAMGIIFLLSPLSGILTSILGLRITAVLGGLIASTGMILSSFVPYNVDVLLFTYSFIYGLGASFAYTPSLAILGHYFKKHLGLVNGIVTIGSSVFTVIIPPVMELVIQEYGLEWLFRLLALFTFGIALCGLLFKPIPLMITKVPTEDKGLKGFLLTVIDVQIWQNKKYLIWALSMPVVLFGYFVPYVHIKSFIKENFNAVNESLPLQCIATASGMGRLIFGWLGDKPLNKILLQQISFYAIGVLTIILPFVHMFGMLIVISLGMGLFEGAFISLIGPIAFELCGRAHAAQAIGWMLGLSATTLSLGPPLAIYIHSYTSSYTIPFVFAGLSPIIGATLMFSLRYYRFANRNNHHSNGLAIMPADIHIERPSSPGLLLKNGAANHQATL